MVVLYILYVNDDKERTYTKLLTLQTFKRRKCHDIFDPFFQILFVRAVVMRMRTLQAKKVRGCIYLSPSNIWKIRNWRGYQRPKTQILNFAIKYLRENEQVRKTVTTQECLLSRKKTEGYTDNSAAT